MQALEWVNGKVRLLDQSLLPQQEVYLELASAQAVAAAIVEMRVRGAPLIGVAAAYGLALATREIQAQDMDEFLASLRAAADRLAATRPTAVNLAWALKRLQAVAAGAATPDAAREVLLAEAQRLQRQDLEANRRLGRHGAQLIPAGAAILTHCNTGSLATAGYGTALGVIRAAWEEGKVARVYVTETRPVLQGARLTAWELLQDGIPATLLVDSAAGQLLRRRLVGCVVVGADRIARNGDVANKIGTYTLAVLAQHHGIPFYVAAPTSTIDLATVSGDDITIEERPPQEVTAFGGVAVAPPGVAVANPAFDVTPHQYVTAIVTERGVARAPYAESLSALCLSGEMARA